MADFASLHEEADALGDNFMSQMMSSGDLDGTNADATMALANTKTMPDYSPSFLSTSKRVGIGNAGDNSIDHDDASSVSSQLSSASSTTASSQKQDDDDDDDESSSGTTSVSVEEDSKVINGHGGAESSSEDEGATGGGDGDSATSASQSSEELVATDIIRPVKKGKVIPAPKKPKNVKSNSKTQLPLKDGNPKPKLRLSLKVKTALAETKKTQDPKKKTAAASKKRKAEPKVKVESSERDEVDEKPPKKKKSKAAASEDQASQEGVREQAEKSTKGKPGPKPKASSLGGSSGTSAVPPKKRKISTPKSKTTSGATASGGGGKGKGKAAKAKNVNKNKGKKGSGAGNASNDAGPGTALEILLPRREKGRYIRGSPMFFYSSKVTNDLKQGLSSAANRGNGSNPSIQAAALAATTYVPNLKQKLPPFQSPGLLVHPSLGFTASSSNTLSAANLHLEKKLAADMFRNGLEQIGYIYPAGLTERKRKQKKSKNGEETAVVSSQVELLHRGSSTVRVIEDLFDRWITQDEARKMIPKDFIDPIPGTTIDDQNGSDLKPDSTIGQVFMDALSTYTKTKFPDTEICDANESTPSSKKNGAGLSLSERLPQLPQDFKDMLPQTLTSTYAEHDSYAKKWENYAKEVAHRENQIVLFQQAAKQSRKKSSSNVVAGQASGDKAENEDRGPVEIPPIPRPPTPPPKMNKSESLPYHPAPQEHLLRHLDPQMYRPTTSRYHGLLSSAVADPQYVGPNAPGLLGLIHMMSAVGSSANAAAAAAALGAADGSTPGTQRKGATGKKKSGGGGAAPKKTTTASSNTTNTATKTESTNALPVKKKSVSTKPKADKVKSENAKGDKVKADKIKADTGQGQEAVAVVVNDTAKAKKKKVKKKIKESA